MELFKYIYDKEYHTHVDRSGPLDRSIQCQGSLEQDTSCTCVNSDLSFSAVQLLESLWQPSLPYANSKYGRFLVRFLRIVHLSLVRKCVVAVSTALYDKVDEKNDPTMDRAWSMRIHRVRIFQKRGAEGGPGGSAVIRFTDNNVVLRE